MSYKLIDNIRIQLQQQIVNLTHQSQAWINQYPGLESFVNTPGRNIEQDIAAGKLNSVLTLENYVQPDAVVQAVNSGLDQISAWFKSIGATPEREQESTLAQEQAKAREQEQQSAQPIIKKYLIQQVYIKLLQDFLTYLNETFFPQIDQQAQALKIDASQVERLKQALGSSVFASLANDLSEHASGSSSSSRGSQFVSLHRPRTSSKTSVDGAPSQETILTCVFYDGILAINNYDQDTYLENFLINYFYKKLEQVIPKQHVREPIHLRDVADIESLELHYQSFQAADHKVQEDSKIALKILEEFISALTTIQKTVESTVEITRGEYCNLQLIFAKQKNPDMQDAVLACVESQVQALLTHISINPDSGGLLCKIEKFKRIFWLEAESSYDVEHLLEFFRKTQEISLPLVNGQESNIINAILTGIYEENQTIQKTVENQFRLLEIANQQLKTALEIAKNKKSEYEERFKNESDALKKHYAEINNCRDKLNQDSNSVYREVLEKRETLLKQEEQIFIDFKQKYEAVESSYHIKLYASKNEEPFLKEKQGANLLSKKRTIEKVLIIGSHLDSIGGNSYLAIIKKALFTALISNSSTSSRLGFSFRKSAGAIPIKDPVQDLIAQESGKLEDEYRQLIETMQLINERVDLVEKNVEAAKRHQIAVYQAEYQDLLAREQLLSLPENKNTEVTSALVAIAQSMRSLDVNMNARTIDIIKTTLASAIMSDASKDLSVDYFSNEFSKKNEHSFHRQFVTAKKAMRKAELLQQALLFAKQFGDVEYDMYQQRRQEFNRASPGFKITISQKEKNAIDQEFKTLREFCDKLGECVEITDDIAQENLEEKLQEQFKKYLKLNVAMTTFNRKHLELKQRQDIVRDQLGMEPRLSFFEDKPNERVSIIGASNVSAAYQAAAVAASSVMAASTSVASASAASGSATAPAANDSGTALSAVLSAPQQRSTPIQIQEIDTGFKIGAGMMGVSGGLLLLIGVALLVTAPWWVPLLPAIIPTLGLASSPLWVPALVGGLPAAGGALAVGVSYKNWKNEKDEIDRANADRALSATPPVVTSSSVTTNLDLATTVYQASVGSTSSPASMNTGSIDSFTTEPAVQTSTQPASPEGTPPSGWNTPSGSLPKLSSSPNSKFVSQKSSSSSCSLPVSVVEAGNPFADTSDSPSP